MDNESTFCLRLCEMCSDFYLFIFFHIGRHQMIRSLIPSDAKRSQRALLSLGGSDGRLPPSFWVVGSEVQLALHNVLLLCVESQISMREVYKSQSLLNVALSRSLIWI